MAVVYILEKECFKNVNVRTVEKHGGGVHPWQLLLGCRFVRIIRLAALLSLSPSRTATAESSDMSGANSPSTWWGILGAISSIPRRVSTSKGRLYAGETPPGPVEEPLKLYSGFIYLLIFIYLFIYFQQEANWPREVINAPWSSGFRCEDLPFQCTWDHCCSIL